MTENAGRDSRKQSVLQVGRQHDPDPSHSQQVARLALVIFDQTASLHKLDEHARELLEYACLLHDIGWAGGESKHKRRSYEMIKSAALDGFSDAEREIIASVARYHGSKPPREHHLWNEKLSPDDKKKVIYLSAIIRVADALDRSHTAVVEDIQCTVGDRGIELRLKTSRHPDAETWSLRRKKDYFEKTFQSKLKLA